MPSIYALGIVTDQYPVTLKRVWQGKSPQTLLAPGIGIIRIIKKRCSVELERFVYESTGESMQWEVRRWAGDLSRPLTYSEGSLFHVSLLIVSIPSSKRCSVITNACTDRENHVIIDRRTELWYILRRVMVVSYSTLAKSTLCVGAECSLLSEHVLSNSIRIWLGLGQEDLLNVQIEINLCSCLSCFFGSTPSDSAGPFHHLHSNRGGNWLELNQMQLVIVHR
jgi:hypothetical protein